MLASNGNKLGMDTCHILAVNGSLLPLKMFIHWYGVPIGFGNRVVGNLCPFYDK